MVLFWRGSRGDGVVGEEDTMLKGSEDMPSTEFSQAVSSASCAVKRLEGRGSNKRIMNSAESLVTLFVLNGSNGKGFLPIQYRFNGVKFAFEGNGT